MRFLFFVAVLGACGTDTFIGPDGSTSGDGGEAGTGSEGGPPARCDLTKPFMNFKPMSELNTSSSDETGARLTADGLGIVFARDNDIWTASRKALTEPFGNLMALGNVNTNDLELWPMLVGSELYFSRGSPTLGMGIFVATGPSFSNPLPVPAFAPSIMTPLYGPYLVSGTVMYLTRNLRIARAERVQGAWQPGAELGVPINGSGTNVAPVATPDELHLYWSSDRSGSQGYDIWQSDRAKATDPWGTPTQVNALDSGDDEAPTWISADTCAIVFHRRTNGNFDIFVAQRPM